MSEGFAGYATRFVDPGKFFGLHLSIDFEKHDTDNN